MKGYSDFSTVYAHTTSHTIRFHPTLCFANAAASSHGLPLDEVQGHRTHKGGHRVETVQLEQDFGAQARREFRVEQLRAVATHLKQEHRGR
jgi:hypothetical protein